MAFLVPDPYATILAACDTIALSPELHLTRILQLLELTPRSVGSTHVAIFQKASFTFASTGRRNCASAAQPYPQVSKRDDVFVLVIAGACTGAVSGVIAASMNSLSEAMHRILFALGPGENLSSMAELPKLHTLLVLTAGGLVVGLTYLYQTRRPHPIVDPIEANALHGGRMSLTDSVLVSLQSLLSCGFGLSLGIEGGFTQAAGAVGSKVGRLLKRRRHDVRMLVGAGAAGGIAGAFGAPFAGAAYGFELIVGSYTVATLPPVVAAAVAGTLAAHTFVGHTYHVHLEKLNLAQLGHLVTAVALGIACGLLSVVLMRGVTATERLFHRSGLRLALLDGHAGDCLGRQNRRLRLVDRRRIPRRTFFNIALYRHVNGRPGRQYRGQLRFPGAERRRHAEPCWNGQFRRGRCWRADDYGSTGRRGDGRLIRRRPCSTRGACRSPYRPTGVWLFVLHVAISSSGRSHPRRRRRGLGSVKRRRET